MKYLKFLLCFIIVYSCANSETEQTLNNRSFVFVACEGNFGASNGSIHIIDENGETSSVNDIGDVVQSLEVYNNKLFVIVNNSHKILAYDITENGLSLPGIEVSTNGSGPREMVIVNDNLYFTNWNTNDVKILNLFNYTISDFISFNGKPESIIYDNNSLYVGIQLNNDYTDSNLMYRVDPNSGNILNEYEIGYGPTSIINANDEIYVANTYYDGNFNAFFSRKLKADARPINSGPNIIVSPADGRLVASGRIKDSQLIQAKNRHFCTQDLLGGDNTLARAFDNGDFITVYLSPRDYHRVHMPLDGKLREMIYLPGKLFSVNSTTSKRVKNLYSKNERLVCIFDTVRGPMVVVLVGAMIVSGITVNWEDENIFNKGKIQKLMYPTIGKGSVSLKKGDEVGRFMLGSTVVVCFGMNKIHWEDEISIGSVVKMGQSVGYF